MVLVVVMEVVQWWWWFWGRPSDGALPVHWWWWWWWRWWLSGGSIVAQRWLVVVVAKPSPSDIKSFCEANRRTNPTKSINGNHNIRNLLIEKDKKIYQKQKIFHNIYRKIFWNAAYDTLSMLSNI